MSEKLERLLKQILQSTLCHIDGRDLLAELHPRRTLDIKRRVDGVETWFEGDWLSRVHEAVAEAREHFDGPEFVTCTSADWNGTSFDGRPFEPWSVWLMMAMRRNQIKMSRKGMGTDYATWDIGDQYVEPGDRVYQDLSVVKYKDIKP